MIHSLEVLPKHFCRILDGSKTFLVHDSDPGFQPGDTVVLHEWDDKPINPTDKAPRGLTEAEPLTFLVGYIYVFSGSTFILSLLPVPLVPKAKKKVK